MARASVWGLLVGELVQAVPAAVEVVVSEVSPIQLVCERDEHVSAATGIDTQGSRRTTEWERAVMTERGERLPGGNLGGAWRVGDTVRRETGPWSPAVHALLEHLHGRLDGVPCFHGLDEHGREVLDFLPGRIVDVDTEELTDQQLVAVVAWARRLHEAVAGFEHPGPWRGFPPAEATLIGHGDIAPYNVCFDDDTLVGVFDWDMAGPTSVDHELGFIAWNCVPLFRPMPDPWCAARLRLIATTYGQVTPLRVLAAVFDRTQATIDGIERGAAAGDAGMQDLMAKTGEPEPTRRALAALERRRPALESLL